MCLTETIILVLLVSFPIVLGEPPQAIEVCLRPAVRRVIRV